MSVIFLLIINLTWFQRDLNYAKKLYNEALMGEADSLNPFLYFLKAIEFERGGSLQEARNNFEKAKLFSNLEPAIVFLMLKISDKQNLPDFYNDLWNELLKSKIKKGVKEIPEISYYFLNKAGEKILLSAKISQLNKALKISPSFYPAWYEKIKLYYLNFKFLDALKTFFNFSPFFSGNPALKKIFQVTLLRIFIILIFVLISTLILSFTIRKRQSIYFYLPQNIPHVPELEFILSIIFILFIFIGLPLPFLFLLVFPVVFNLENKEKKALFLFSLFLFLITVIGMICERRLVNFINDKNNPDVLLYLTKNSPYDEELIKKWDNVKVKEAELLKAIIYLKGNKIKEAKSILKKMIKTSSDYEVLVNTGNLYFLENKFDSASIFYRRAIEIEPERFEAHFNLAQVAFSLVDLTLFQKEIDMANRIDQQRTEEFTRRIKEFKLIPIIYAYPEKIKNYKYKGENTFLFTDSYLLPPFLILEILVLIFLIFFVKSGRSIFRCRACLKGIPQGGKEVEPVGEVCDVCAKELESTASLKLRQRLAMRLRAKRNNKLKTGILIANFMIPGLGFGINNSFFLLTFTSMIFGISLIIILFTSFKTFGIILYMLSIIIGLIYYITGGRIDASI